MTNKASSNGNNQHIDNTPKFSQQRRSPPPRRRTDFSHLFQALSSCSSSPSDLVLCQERLMKSSTEDESPFSGIIAAFDESQMEDVQKLPPSSSDYEFNKQLLVSDKPYCSPDKRDSSESINMPSESPIRRSARARKISVRFDKETIPSKSTKQARRTKILRYLGLAAPAGSPYARPTASVPDHLPERKAQEPAHSPNMWNKNSFQVSMGPGRHQCTQSAIVFFSEGQCP